MRCALWEDVDEMCRATRGAHLVATINHESLGAVALLQVAGELDIATAQALTEELTVAVLLTGSLLVVDLEACTYVGIQPFEAIERAAGVLDDRGAQLVVRMPPPSFQLIRSHVRTRALVIARPPRR